MTATHGTRTAAQAGKSTRSSAQLPAGEATRTLTLPHLPYADAIHAALDAVAMPPSSFEAGLRHGRTGASELFLRAVWPVGTGLLGDGVRPTGLTLAWSHVTGWSAHNALEDCVLLDVDVLAAPTGIVHAALHMAEHDLSRPWQPPDGVGRWSQALDLDIALARFEDRR